MGAVLLQFPSWVFPSMQARELILENRNSPVAPDRGGISTRQLVQRKERGGHDSLPHGRGDPLRGGR